MIISVRNNLYYYQDGIMVIPKWSPIHNKIKKFIIKLRDGKENGN